MGLFSSKTKTDPALKASQQASAQIMDMMAKQTLPALPVVPQAAQPTFSVPTSLPSYLGGGSNMVFPRAALPNQLSMIASQLQAGGYGAPDDSIYRRRVVAPTPPPPPKPAPAPAPSPVRAAAPVAVAKPAAAPAPAAKKPMGFTGVQTGYPEHENPGTFQTLSQFVNFLNANRRK